MSPAIIICENFRKIWQKLFLPLTSLSSDFKTFTSAKEYPLSVPPCSYCFTKCQKKSIRTGFCYPRCGGDRSEAHWLQLQERNRKTIVANPEENKTDWFAGMSKVLTETLGRQTGTQLNAPSSSGVDEVSPVSLMSVVGFQNWYPQLS